METANTEKMENGFYHHGVATPISNHRSTVSTVDGNGNNIVLVWLFDLRGGYAILMINANNGSHEEFPVPFDPGHDCPYASILSTDNKFYTHFNSYFSEFDPVKRAFTFHQKTAPQMAMSMTEDDEGRIWSATYPNCGAVRFDPQTRELKDYGHLYDQNWRQYPRSVATDETGWAYLAVGSTSGQIISLNPETGEATPVIPEQDRVQGSAYVYRDLNGNVYGKKLHDDSAPWIEFHRGQTKEVGILSTQNPKPYISSSQSLFHTEFPDGKQLKECNLVDRILIVEDPKTGQEKKFSFDYTSEGAHLMGVAIAPDNTVCGGTAFPMRFFSYNPKTDTWINRAAHGQCNTVARGGDRFFVGGYGHGYLLEWDPSKPWVDTAKDNPNSNPRFHTECVPTINRPHALLAHPNGKTVLLAGTPQYGYTGGGLLIWNRDTSKHTLLEHTDLLPQQSIMSLTELPDGNVLAGFTTSPGTGGEQKAKEAELGILNLDTNRIDWHEVIFPGVQSYLDLCPAPNGLVYGIADRERFFVFDPEKKKIVHESNTQTEFGPTTSQQGPRIFVTAPDGTVYILFVKGVGRIDHSSWDITFLAESPVPIQGGGDILDDHIYFASGSHLYSYRVTG